MLSFSPHTNTHTQTRHSHTQQIIKCLHFAVADLMNKYPNAVQQAIERKSAPTSNEWEREATEWRQKERSKEKKHTQTEAEEHC